MVKHEVIIKIRMRSNDECDDIVQSIKHLSNLDYQIEERIDLNE